MGKNHASQYANFGSLPQKQGEKSDFSAHINLNLLSLSSPKVINAIQRPKYYKNFFCWNTAFYKNCRLSTFQIVVWALFFVELALFCRLSTFWKWASETFFIGFLPHKLFQICFFPLARRTSFLLCKWFDKVTAGKKTGRLSQLLYIDFRMLLQYVFRILQPETGYPFAECHFIRSLDISGKIGRASCRERV